MAGGTASGSACQSVSARRTAANVWETVSPVKSCRPVSISKTTTPNDQISLRLSTAEPLAGPIIRNVPIHVPQPRGNLLFEATALVAIVGVRYFAKGERP